jgi:hypothetical protein
MSDRLHVLLSITAGLLAVGSLLAIPSIYGVLLGLFFLLLHWQLRKSFHEKDVSKYPKKLGILIAWLGKLFIIWLVGMVLASGQFKTILSPVGPFLFLAYVLLFFYLDYLRVFRKSF